MLIHWKASRERHVPLSIVVLLCVTLISQSIAGCAGMSPRTKATLTCGVVGGIIGAAVGALVSKKAWKGALIGGAIGTVTGMGTCFIIASYKNTEIADYQTTSQEINYEPSSGDVVEVTNYTLYPTEVLPGQKVAFNAQYFIMTPNPEQEITVTETRTIKAYDQKLESYVEMGDSSNQITMKPGTRQGDGSFNIHNLTPQGNYLLTFSVEYEGKKAEKSHPLIIGTPATTVAYTHAEGTKEAVTDEEFTETEQISKYFVVTVNATSIRARPGTKFFILGQLTEGERYPVVEEVQNPGEGYPWYKIRLDDGREAWVNGASGKIEE